jgi:hypothetical protein
MGGALEGSWVFVFDVLLVEGDWIAVVVVLLVEV